MPNPIKPPRISKELITKSTPNNCALLSFPETAAITPAVLSGLKPKSNAFAALTGPKLLNKITSIGATISSIAVVCAFQSPFLILSAISNLLCN